MHPYTITTERLTLRALTAQDAAAVYAWASDPEVNRYMPYPLYHEIAEAERWIASFGEETSRHLEFGFVRRADNLLIGAGSVAHRPEGDWEIGYNLRRDCWRQGYAAEAAQGMIRFAFETFGARDFYGIHADANPASGAVLRKCGMRPAGEEVYGRIDGSATWRGLCYRLRLDEDGRPC